MDDETKLKILDWWIENFDRVSEVPEELKEKVSEDEAIMLFHDMGGDNNQSTLMDFAQKIRTKIRDDFYMETTKKQTEILEKQTKISKEQNKIQNEANEIQKGIKGFQRWQIFLTAVLIFCTLGIGLLGYSISVTQTGIMDNQTKLFKLTNAPLQPTLKIKPVINDLIFENKDVTDEVYWDWPQENRWAQIALTIQNLGRSRTGNFTCSAQLESESHGLGVIIDKKYHLINLESLETREIVLQIYEKNCIKEESCNISDVPLGSHRITITCDDCRPCDKQKYEETINFCIHNRTNPSLKECIDLKEKERARFEDSNINF